MMSYACCRKGGHLASSAMQFKQSSAGASRPASLATYAMRRESGGRSNDGSNARRSDKGESYKNTNRRKGRPAWTRSPDDTPLRDGNRDRLMGLLTERAAKTLLYYMYELNPTLYGWWLTYLEDHPIPKDGNWDDISEETIEKSVDQSTNLTKTKLTTPNNLHPSNHNDKSVEGEVSDAKATLPKTKGTNSLWFSFKLKLSNFIEMLLNLIDGSKFDPYRDLFLSNNFEPVQTETMECNLEVIDGNIPKDMPDGAFIRTGPNPQFAPSGRYHWFDGDGMVHSVRIKERSASYCNRYVETSKLCQERRVGKQLFLSFGSMRGFFGLMHVFLESFRRRLGVIDESAGRGRANTALAFHAGRLLALQEDDIPYWLQMACMGLLETIGRCTFDGELTHAFTAHPKIDPETKEMFAFGYKIDIESLGCWVVRIDKEGKQECDYRVDMPKPVMMHDCALTEKYFILMDSSLVFDPQAMIKKGSLPFVFDKSRPTRFGVLDRYANNASSLRWFAIEPLVIFHVANAWERADGVIELYACTYREFDISICEDTDDAHAPHLTRIEMDLSSGKTSCEELCQVPGDFPVIPARMVGRKTKYCYTATVKLGVNQPLFDGICKVDLSAPGPETSVAGKLSHGDGRYGGEAYFVPRKGGKKEDDGYLMTYVWDEKLHQSEFVVYSAESMSPKPVVRIALPQRVPYGFHSLWVAEEELKPS